MEHIKSFVTVCDEVGEVALGEATFKSSEGKSEIALSFESKGNDVVKISHADLGLSAQVGGASKIDALSILICKDAVTVIPRYTEDEMNLYGCCACCTKNGTRWCVYGSSGCVCC